MNERTLRGQQKLEAALERYGLADHVRGARCVDVGASTGGFTSSLLAHGAAHVTAIDVGHGQLRSALAADPRVTALERFDFKRAPLALAPGPFDFFTVDVSFVAARSQLRGLAFRLREGAHGVVLLKPQFELASAEVERRGVADPALRAKALARFRERAEALAFELVEASDSPVPGGKGTVEILVHLRFRGPAPHRREPSARPVVPAPSGSPVAAAAPERIDWFAIAAPGLEQVVGAELATLPGAQGVRVVAGGVELAGPLAVGMRANLWSRAATRLVARVGRVEATDFSRLRRQTERLPWERFASSGQAVRVRAACSHCKLFHTGAVAENVEAAIVDRLRRARAGRAPQPAAAELPVLEVLVRGVDDRFTLSVDASGELLHRRGFRLETARAPFRETLAAGLLALCEWDGSTPLVDPLCGSGTVAIEAARLARRIAPGLDRSFAFEQWPCFEGPSWQALLDEARGGILPRAPAPIVAADRDPAAVRATQRNAERASVAGDLRIEPRAFRELEPPPGRGLVVLDPPYGRRLGDERSVRRLHAELGAVLRDRYAGWQVGILVADRRAIGELGVTPLAEHRLVNGGLRVTLVRARMGPHPSGPGRSG